ncbi:MAG TPA: 50S ribosomal protein L18 [Rhodothermales bacterium]|nr:50S ribosomal protein L18 [Rhodothermales bacterium]
MARKNQQQRRTRVKQRIRSKISGTSKRPRLTVYRSNTNIYAQLVDDAKGHTVASASSLEDGVAKGKPVDVSREVGRKLAEKAKATGVESVIFDRNGYKYHGRVQALAEGAREGGLVF